MAGNAQNAKPRPQKAKKRSRRPDFLALGGIDVFFLLLVIAILTIGLVMLFSASYTYAFYNKKGDSTYFFKRQLIFAVVGVICMLLISKLRYDYLKILAVPGLIVSWGLLVIVLILPASFGEFHRWINLGFFTFQPSEIAKLAIILFCAYEMDRNHKKIVGKSINRSKFADGVRELSGGHIVVYNSFLQLLFYALVITVTAGLVYLENHLSGTILILAIGVIMMYLGEIKRHWFVLIAVIAAVAIIIFVLNPQLLEKYAGARITAWLDKSYDPKGARWQTNNSLYAIGSGGLFGVGLGNSYQKHMWLPEPQNDFIFAILCEELGFIGAIALIALFVLFMWRGFVIAKRAPDTFSSVLVAGLTAKVGIQAMLNIAVVTSSIPTTGIALPFFSYGGTALVMQLAEMGIILSVSRYSSQKRV